MFLIKEAEPDAIIYNLLEKRFASRLRNNSKVNLCQ